MAFIMVEYTKELSDDTREISEKILLMYTDGKLDKIKGGYIKWL